MTCRNTEALILLHAVLCQIRKVPRVIVLDIVCDIAVLVDYYDFREAVELFSDLWIDNLKDTIPSECTPELMSWIWVSLAFDNGNIFGMATTSAFKLYTRSGPIVRRGLPIPNELIGK